MSAWQDADAFGDELCVCRHSRSAHVFGCRCDCPFFCLDEETFQ